MEKNLFRLPDPIPLGAILLGPDTWTVAHSPGNTNVRAFSDPQDAKAFLDSAIDPSGSASDQVSHLILIHQDTFAGADGADRLVNWLENLTALQGVYLPVLLHGNLPAKQLVRFFRAGLFDALNCPLDRAGWINLLIRTEKRLERQQQNRLLLEESGETQMVLRELRRQVDGQAARNAGELLRAQESLESANRQLKDAMDELSLLYKFGRKLSQAPNWDGVLRDLLKSLAAYVQAGGAALVLRSAPGGSYSPRKTWQWDESSWDKVLINLQDQVDDALAESIMAPGVFSVDHGREDGPRGSGRRIIALPLEYQGVRLGFLLLLFVSPEARGAVARRYLPFLQTVQVVLGEEIAGAQMLDRIRDIGAFNSTVLETVSSAIWVIDAAGNTVFCNRAGQEMLTGQASSIATPDEFSFQIGRGRHQDQEVLYGELPELFLDARLRMDQVEGLLLPQMIKRAKRDYRGEGKVIRSDSQAIPVMVQTAMMPGRRPDEAWLVLVAEDLRDARKLEAERLRSEQLAGLVEMSATLAHEIRNPLMGLSAQAELLASQLPDEDPKFRYIQVITGEVARINDTITRMLNFVRPYEPQRAAVDLWELCLDVRDLTEPQSRNKMANLSVVSEASPPGVQDWLGQVDGSQIKQVLLNLVINAIDAVDNGGKVDICLAPAENLEVMNTEMGTGNTVSGFQIEVRDNGPGIGPEDLAKVFRPFFTTKSAGTGLGLSICQKIVAAHGGEIQACREGGFTVFRILLPQLDPGTSQPESKTEEA